MLKKYQAKLLNMSLLKILEMIDPYIPIAFLLVSSYILWKLRQSYNTFIIYVKRNRCDFKSIISDEYYKHCAEITLKYIIMITLIKLEVAVNLIGSVGWIIVNTHSHDLPKTFNMSETCQISDNKNLVALGSWIGWPLSLLTRVAEIISFCLLPTICCALDVMRREFLSHQYKGRLRHWKIYIVLCSGSLFILCNTLWTFLIFYVLQTVLHWFNLSMYVIYSKRLYEFIRQTQKEAHSQTYNPETKTTSNKAKQELDKCTKNTREFFYTTIYTFLLFFVLILQVSSNAVILVVSTFVMNNCYFSEITFGYIPVFHFDSATLHAISEFREKGYIFTFSLSYLHQCMMLLAYFAVLWKLCFYRLFTGNEFKRLRENTKSMVQETYKYRN